MLRSVLPEYRHAGSAVSREIHSACNVADDLEAQMIRIILIAWAVLSIPTAFGLYQLCRVSGQSSTSEPEEKRGKR